MMVRLGPGDGRQDRELRQVEFQDALQRGKTSSRIDWDQAALAQPARHPRIAGGIGPGAPVQALRRQALSTPVAGEGVEEGIGGAIGTLSGIAQEAAGRREQDEAAGRQPRGQPVQVPGAQHLRRQHRLEAAGCLALQDVVVDDSGGMDHAAQRRPAVGEMIEQIGERPEIGDVDLPGFHRYAQGAQLGEPFRGLGTGGAAPQEQQVADALPCKALRRGQTQAPEPAADQPGAFG
jgi:hypothetical protein